MFIIYNIIVLQKGCLPGKLMRVTVINAYFLD